LARTFSQTFWAQASYLYSTLRGNYSGAIREADGQPDPGINGDYDYNQFLTNAYGTWSSTARTSSGSTPFTTLPSGSRRGCSST
jgi:hypothetical protein